MPEKVLQPTPKTVKRLFAMSGNRCAFPRCTTPVVIGDVVTGEIAHICAERPEGPRYDPNQTPEQRRDFENLILLCGVHHTVVDDAEQNFPPQSLREIKQKHESQSVEIKDDDELEHASGLLIRGGVTVVVPHAQNSTIAGVIQNSTFTNNNYTSLPAEDSPPSRLMMPRDGKGAFRVQGEALGRYIPFDPYQVKQADEIVLTDGPRFWMRLHAREISQRDFTFQKLTEASARRMHLLEGVYGILDISLQAKDGIGRCMYKPETPVVNMLFRNGEIWYVDANVVFHRSENESFLALSEIRKRLPTMLENSLTILRNLDIDGPLECELGIEKIEGVRVAYDTVDHRNPWSYPKLLTDEVIVNGIAGDTNEFAKIVFDFTESVFGECGMQVPSNLE